jgi:radical SAM superfamily enzyme YgiQ (UPF0313 family)
MTYWYPGVKETIAVIKETLPDVPVVLGGIYATLCAEHAAVHSGADRLFTGPGEKSILALAGGYTGFAVRSKFDADNLDTYPYPAFDLQRKITYIPLLTSRGCPFACSYCASHVLNPKRMRRDPAAVVEEIRHWHRNYGVRDFTFYDDALLVDAERHAIPILEGIIESGLTVRFHTPNALHIREISAKTARLMFKAGFETLRLGLETAAFEKRKELDRKVTADEFTRAVRFLREAGFRRPQIGAYLLAGLPGQNVSALQESIQVVKEIGITPVLAYYTPIPHTALWPNAVASSRFALESDPVFANNAIIPCQAEAFSWKTISRLKDLAAGG